MAWPSSSSLLVVCTRRHASCMNWCFHSMALPTKRTTRGLCRKPAPLLCLLLAVRPPRSHRCFSPKICPFSDHFTLDFSWIYPAPCHAWRNLWTSPKRARFEAPNARGALRQQTPRSYSHGMRRSALNIGYGWRWASLNRRGSAFFANSKTFASRKVWETHIFAFIFPICLAETYRLNNS